jgi:hypothetical protein
MAFRSLVILEMVIGAYLTLLSIRIWASTYHALNPVIRCVG